MSSILTGLVVKPVRVRKLIFSDRKLTNAARYFIPSTYKNRYGGNYVAKFDGACGRLLVMRYTYDTYNRSLTQTANFQWHPPMSASLISDTFPVEITCNERIPIGKEDYIKPFKEPGCPCIECLADVGSELHEDLVQLKAKFISRKMFNYHKTKYGHVKN